jgi:ribosomal protein L9
MDEKKFNSLSKPQQDVVIKIATEAERQGVNPTLAIAIAEAETGGKFGHFDKDKVLTSPAGARGVMQIMPDTAQLYNKKMGAEIDPDDEDSNIKGGVFILKDLLTKYKSPRIAVAMYNASPKANAEFVKKYETDPDAAIMSLKPETHKYSLRVSQNFNLDDDKETGLISASGGAEEPKSTNPFDNYESESSKFKREQEERDRNKKPETNPEDQQGGLTAPDIGAGAGAIANLLFPPMTNPERAVKVDTGKAEEANLTAQDKLELARRNLQTAAPQGVGDLEDAFRQSQGELERMKNEQALLEARLKGIPSAPAPSAPTPQEQFEVEKRKITGAGAPYNTVQAMASERVPYNLANQAIDMTHNEGHGKGAHDIVDIFNQGKAKASDLGMSDFVLTGEKGPGELYLPKPLAEPRNTELEQRAEQNRQQQELLAQQQEQERLRLQAELNRVSQERASQGAQHNVLTGQVKGATPLQRAVTKAETDAEIARRKLARAQQQPNAVGRQLQNVGAGSAKMGALPRVGVGAGAGYLGVMSYQQALERYKAGDTSEAVLKALEAGAAAAAVVPPAGKPLTKVRGAGLLGGLGLGGFELTRRLLKDAPQE